MNWFLNVQCLKMCCFPGNVHISSPAKTCLLPSIRVLSAKQKSAVNFYLYHYKYLNHIQNKLGKEDSKVCVLTRLLIG
jgi:hypothetical protein